MIYVISDEEYEELMVLLSSPPVYKPKLAALLKQDDPWEE